MPPRIPDDKRAAIAADIRAGTLSRNAIARKHDVSPATVTNLAREAGHTDAFDRTHAEKGARARRFDAKAARARLLVDLYSDAQRFRGRAWEPYTQMTHGRDGPELVTTKLPPLRDQQSAYTALAIAVDKAIKIEQVDAADATETGRSMISELRDALGVAYEQMTAEAGDGAGDVPADGDGAGDVSAGESGDG